MINEFVKKQIDYIEDQCKVIKPLVVIRCITYNHEPYLRDALEGFVMQQTDFPFVAIIHDDASTDKTAEILKEYAEKYPDIIFPLYEKENQFSKKNGSLGKIMNIACDATGAKYIAMCEGDDYWIDSLKLQKQVDFLSTHHDFSLCFSKSNVIGVDSSIPTSTYDHLEEKEYSADEIIKKWTIPTATSVIKKEVFENIPRHPDFCVGDNVLFLTAASKGKLYCLNDVTSVYRRTYDGWVLKTGKYEVLRKSINHNIALMTVFPDLKLPSLKITVIKKITRYTYYLIKNFQNPLSYIKKGYSISPTRFVTSMLSFPFQYIHIKLKNKFLS